jgi:hypothetical protein
MRMINYIITLVLIPLRGYFLGLPCIIIGIIFKHLQQSLRRPRKKINRRRGRLITSWSKYLIFQEKRKLSNFQKKLIRQYNSVQIISVYSLL